MIWPCSAGSHPANCIKIKKRLSNLQWLLTFTNWHSPIQIGHYSVFHLPVSFSTANPGSLIQFLNRTIPQKPMYLLAFLGMSQLSHAPRVRIIANGTTWTKATSATQMANASTAELTATTGYNSKTAAGWQPTCSKFNTIFHRGCPSGQFLFFAHNFKYLWTVFAICL